MAKAGQYYNGTDWQQFGLTTADRTLGSGAVASVFNTIKDANDNLYILCLSTTNVIDNARIIKIDKDGNKTSALINITYPSQKTERSNLVLSKDGLTIFVILSKSITTTTAFGLYSFSSNIANGVEITPTLLFAVGNYNVDTKFAIYKDLYIWVASGTTVGIYNYTTKAELASASINTFFTESTSSSCDKVDAISLSTNGTDIYLAMNLSIPAGGNRTVIGGLRYEIGGTWAKLFEIILSTEASPRQLLIDPFGDLIILTNSDTASTLLKYTTTGVQIGADVMLDNPSYNLNIGKLKDDGSYKLYYQTALKTFSVNNTTAHAEIPALVNHVEIRGTGNIGFGSNYTGQQPSVYA